MMKQIFTLAALAAMSVPMSAETLDLTLDDLGCGWGSTYDPATKTITYESAWTAKAGGFRTQTSPTSPSGTR